MKLKLQNIVSPMLIFAITIFTQINAQESSNMTFLANWGSGEGQNFAVFSLGTLTYYGVGNKIKIADYSNPASPVELSTVTLNSTIDEIVKSGNYLYAVAGNFLYIILAQNPTAPSIVGSLEFQYSVRSLATRQNYAYLAGGDGGLRIVDISSPNNPVEVASVDTIGYTQGITISGNYVYAATGSNLDIFDVTNPSSPSWLSSFPVDDWTQNVTVSGSYAYISDYSYGLFVVDVSNPSSPSEVGYASTGFRTTKVVLDGDYAYVANGDSMRVLNVNNPANPVMVSAVPMNDRAVNISVGVGHVFVADRNYGLHCVNISNPANPSIVSEATIEPPASGTAFSTFFDDNKVYVAYGGSGLRIIDVNNPSAPALLGEVDLPGDSRGVVVKNGYAFVAARDEGVRVVDATNPSSPVELVPIMTPRARGISISGDYVYVAASDSGAAIIDVSDPPNPVWITSASDFYGEGIAASENIVAVTKWDDIKLFDVTDPLNPVAKGETGVLNTGTAGMAVSGGYLYVSDFDSLRIFDISNLDAPVQVGIAYKGGEWDGTVVVEDNYAYTVSEGEGIKVFDITDKTAPTEIAYYDGANSSRGISVNEGFAFVAERTAGVSIYKNDLVVSIDDKNKIIPAEFTLLQNYPNPFNPSTTIKFDLNREGRVKLQIVNSLGQVVDTVFDDFKPAGSYIVKYNAEKLASGIYFYTLSNRSSKSVKKMTLVK